MESDGLVKLYKRAIGAAVNMGATPYASAGYASAHDFAGWYLERHLRGVGLRQRLEHAFADWLRDAVWDTRRRGKETKPVLLGASPALLDTLPSQAHSSAFSRDSLACASADKITRKARTVLTSDQWQVFKKIFLEDRTKAECSQELGISSAAVTCALKRIRARLNPEYDHVSWYRVSESEPVDWE